MNILQAIVLGLVQGLTEFIPISSTAHLRIVPALLGWQDPGAAATAVIQFGTLVAVIIYFFGDLVRMTKAFFAGLVSRKLFADPYSALAWYVILGTIPIVILGLAFKDFIETTARGLWIISFAMIGMAIVLLAAEWWAAKRQLRPIEEVNGRDALAIGLGQCLSLIPGMSRSGSTIMAGLFRRLSHAAAARFSFLLSIPAITAAGVLELWAEREHLAALGWGPIAVAILVAFVSGWASIWFLISYLKTHTTKVFIYYRLALGAIMIALLAGGYL